MPRKDAAYKDNRGEDTAVTLADILNELQGGSGSSSGSGG